MNKLIFVVAAFLSQNIWASIDDFNQLIEETHQQEELLREKLMNQSGRPELGLKSQKDLEQVRREMVQADAENVVVDDSGTVTQAPQYQKFSKGLDKKNMKRISKELDITDQY
jgi:hypothetical protein